MNQIESSDFTTTSFGELSGLPSNLSISTVMVPSYSVRVTRRVSCSQVTSRPWRSRVLPLALFEGLRKTLTRAGLLVPAHDAVVRDVAPQQVAPVAELDRAFVPAHAGGDAARRSASARRYLLKLGSSIWTAGSG